MKSGEKGKNKTLPAIQKTFMTEKKQEKSPFGPKD